MQPGYPGSPPQRVAYGAAGFGGFPGSTEGYPPPRNFGKPGGTLKLQIKIQLFQLKFCQ